MKNKQQLKNKSTRLVNKNPVECLAIIPARSGSKGIRHKNIQEVGGKPMLAWSILHASSANNVTRTIVSTDSEEYAAIAREYGADTPFLRPAEISGDHATDLDVFFHALEWLQENEGYAPDICVHLRPTCPVRNPKIIDEIIDILQSTPNLDSVRTITPTVHPPYKMWHRRENGILTPLLEVPDMAEPWNEPRQKLPETYLQTASIDVMWANVIREQRSMTGRRIYGFVESDIYDIDSPEDLVRVNRKMKMNVAPINKKSEIKTICCDIDGVIAAIEPTNDYNLSKPREEIITHIRQLYQQGHHIILFTARGTMTGIDWRAVTEKQMKEWGVPYHELHFGKPAADYYIDDRALRDDELNQII